jgi:hypothetical protein
VLRALYTRDADTLGAFLAAPPHQQLEQRKLDIVGDYLGVLASESMLRPDLRPSDLDYALPNIVFGFFAAEPFLSPATGLTLEHKADQLAETIRRAFEPVARANKAAAKRAAAKAIPILERLAHAYRTATYGGDSHD